MAWPFSRRDAGPSTIIEFDEHGRVIRIPGIYPAPEQPMPYHPMRLVLIAVAIFVLLGLFAPLVFATYT